MGMLIKIIALLYKANENHTINVLVLFGILNSYSRFIVIINFAYIT